MLEHERQRRPPAWKVHAYDISAETRDYFFCDERRLRDRHAAFAAEHHLRRHVADPIVLHMAVRAIELLAHSRKEKLERRLRSAVDSVLAARFRLCYRTDPDQIAFG